MRYGGYRLHGVPGLRMISDRVHETVVTRPRDVRRAGDPVDLHWVKARRKCGNPACPRKTFTEPAPRLSCDSDFLRCGMSHLRIVSGMYGNGRIA